MRNHIAFKFLAILLAALFLFGAAVSAAGLIALGLLDLHPGQTVRDRFEEEMHSCWAWEARDIAGRYASLNLGNIPENAVDVYYQNDYQYRHLGMVSYRLEDAQGNLLESDDVSENAVAYTYTIGTRYMQAVDIAPSESREPIVPPELETAPENQTDPVAPTGETARTEASTEPDASRAAGETARTEDGEAGGAQANKALTEVPDAGEETAATEMESLEAETASPGEEDGTDEELNPEAAESDWETLDYMDDNGEKQSLCYTWEQTPEYRVTVYVSPEYAEMDQAPGWRILELAYTWRAELIKGLALCLLVFALLAVYLCCAAGRKPGTDVVSAGGLNRMPLDLYGFLVILGVGCIGVVFAEGADDLLNLERTLAISVVCYAGYFCGLMVVGFFFALAAQVKTPEYFWWRNSLCGRLWSLLIRVCRWVLKLCLLILHGIPGAARRGWNLAARVFRACRKLILWTWNLMKQFFGAVWGFIARWAKALGRSLSRMYSMLPLIWQWLVAIPLLFFLLLINIGSASPAGILLRMGIVLLATVYLASAFGTLLAGARRMCDGDLGTKVDDKMLVGCFREFAESLNGLSDAAVAAAREQSKSERMRSELITNVSHDIKTPLTSIINYVDLLQMPHTPEQEKEYLAVLSRQSARMKKLIDDLMEMSKAASGSLNVDIIQLDAGETINQALGEFTDKLAAADLTPVFHQPEKPVLMMADGRLAWRAMSNLLSNAVKYALPGTRLYIDLNRSGQNVMISMKNISREQLNVSADELMERFVRGDLSRNTEGSGLGLNIAKNLMELQKGQLQLLVDGDLFKATLIFPAAEE